MGFSRGPHSRRDINKKMGSSFSITNDTNHDIWVWEDVNVEAILYTVSGVLIVGGIAAGVATAGASAAAGTAAGISSIAIAAAEGTVPVILSSTGVVMGTIAPATVAGLTAGTWTIVSIASGGGGAALSLILNLSLNEATKIENSINAFKKDCNRRLEPGQRYVSKGSLSLTKSIWLMSEQGEQVKRACWTGGKA